VNADHEPPRSPADAGERQSAGRESDDDELRAAYEEELNRITSADLMLQAAVSLLNLAGRRLGLAPAGPDDEPAAAGAQRDLEQVRDAIDGVRALFGVLERRFARELTPLREALSQLQLAYAREARADAASAGGQGAAEQASASQGAAEQAAAGQREEEEQGPEGGQEPDARRPGPAEASGRLWVPGR
jgi:hypothetical protein